MNYRRRSGFTLLELVLAMIIVATLIPVLYAALHAGFNAKIKADAAVEPPRTAEIAMDIIRQDLGDALAPTGQLAYTFEATQGKDDRSREADDLQFCSTADSPQHAAANGEVKFIELTVMTAPNGDHVLVRKVIRNLLSPQESANQIVPPGNPDVEVICRGVGGFSLRYFDGSAWDTTWDCTQEDYTVPAAVEVTLTLDRPNGNSTEPDGSRCFRYVRVIPLACSTAAFDSTVNSGTLQ
jgi:prepilin-type N-terminal cleavage/methylation domain-containing protein